MKTKKKCYWFIFCVRNTTYTQSCQFYYQLYCAYGISWTNVCKQELMTDWSNNQSSQISLQCTNTCSFTLSLTHPLQYIHSECNAYKSDVGMALRVSSWLQHDAIIINEKMSYDIYSTKNFRNFCAYFEKQALAIVYPTPETLRKLTFLLFSQKRTLTMWAWIAFHETQWCTFAYSLGRTWPEQINMTIACLTIHQHSIIKQKDRHRCSTIMYTSL